jgi:hypothetical protein
MPSICKNAECAKNAVFGFTKAEFCKAHKLDGMIDVKNKKCKEAGCTLTASYGNPGESKRLYCAKHAPDAMANVTHNKCIANGCSKYPSYNLPGATKPIYCKDHCNDQMVDVKNKRCLADNCDLAAWLAAPKEASRLYCASHCPNRTIESMIKRCSNCLSVRANRKYRLYCTRCHLGLNPDDPLTGQYDLKRTSFLNELTSTYPDMIIDKTSLSRYSTRVPDAAIELDTHVILIEIDEDAYAPHDAFCDVDTLMEIKKRIADKHLVMIRVNPDRYTSDQHKAIRPIFETVKGVYKMNKTEFNRRLSSLRDSIRDIVACPPSKPISMIQICYTE